MNCGGFYCFIVHSGRVKFLLITLGFDHMSASLNSHLFSKPVQNFISTSTHSITHRAEPTLTMNHTSMHKHTHITVRHTSPLLLVIFLEVLLLRDPETSSDRNLGPLVGFIFFSFADREDMLSFPSVSFSLLLCPSW